MVGDNRIGQAELEVQRRAQRSGRYDPTIAEPAPAVDDSQDQILGQRRVLQTIIHDDGIAPGAGGLDGARTGGTVPRHQRRRLTRQQQWLIANVRSPIIAGVDPVRA